MASLSSSLSTKQWWVELAAEKEPFRYRELLEKAAGQVKAREIRPLLERCRRGSEPERYAAMNLLWELSRRRDGKLAGSRKAGWLRSIEQTARREYPASRVGKLAFQIWRLERRAAAESFVVDELDLEGRSDAELFAVVMELRAFGSDRARRRLDKMRGLRGRAAVERKLALAALKPVTREGLENLADVWREERTSAALQRVFSRLMQDRPVGTVPVEEVIGLLGTPTRRGKRILYFAPSLVVELDARERVHGFRFN